jgi:hypothetical protein
MLAKVSVLQRFEILILVGGAGRTAVTLADPNLILYVIENGARVATPVATLGLVMAEVDSINQPGVYSLTLTPAVVGELSIFALYTGGTTSPGSWQWDVFTNDLSDIALLVAAYTGAATATITVEDALAAPIANVQVDIYAADDTTLLVSGLVTNVSGVVTVALNDGSYRVHLTKSRVTFTTPETLTMSGATAATYSGVVAAAGVPVSPALCTVFGTLTDLAGSALLNTGVRATVVSHPTLVGGAGVSVETPETFTNAAGYFELTLLRGAVVNLEIDAIGLRTQVTIPAAATADFITLL